MEYDDFVSYRESVENQNNNNNNENNDDNENDNNSSLTRSEILRLMQEGNSRETDNDEDDVSDTYEYDEKKKEKLLLELDEFQYKHIQKYNVLMEEKCVICFENFKRVDIIKELPCKHIYHKDCILKWLKDSNICPLCKYDLTKDIIEYEDDQETENEN